MTLVCPIVSAYSCFPQVDGLTEGAEQPPKIEDFVDENGIRTIIEYSINEEGKKVKVTTARSLALPLFHQAYAKIRSDAGHR